MTSTSFCILLGVSASVRARSSNPEVLLPDASLTVWLDVRGHDAAAIAAAPESAVPLRTAVHALAAAGADSRGRHATLVSSLRSDS